MWVIIDAGARDDLIRAFAEGRLNVLCCATCGKTGEINGPLLVWRPRDVPQAFFAPGGYQSEADANTSFASFAGRVWEILRDEWSERWQTEPLVLEREALRYVLARDVDADLASLQADGPESVAPPGHPYLDVLVTLREQRARGLFAPEAVEQLLWVADVAELRALLDERPEIVSEAAEGALANALTRHRGHRRETTARFLEGALEVVRRGLVAGATVAEDEWLRRDRALERLVEAVEAPRRTGEHLRSIDAALAVLAPFRERMPQTWAQANHMAAKARVHSVGADRPAQVERAMAEMNAAASFFEATAWPLEHALIEADLGSLLVTRPGGDADLNVERAVGKLRTAEDALARISADEADSDSKARARLELAGVRHNLGLALLGRVHGDRDEHLREAIHYLELALETRSARDLPFDWAKTQMALGVARLRERDRQRAVHAFDAALTVFTADDYPLNFVEAHANSALAWRLAVPPQDEELERAADHYRAALTIADPESHPSLAAKLLHMLGATYAEAGRWNRAAEAYGKALSAGREELEAVSLISARVAVLRDRGDRHVASGYAFAAAGDLRRSAETLESGRARILGGALARDAADLDALMSARPDAVQRFRDAAQALRAVEREERRVLHEGFDLQWSAALELEGVAAEARNALAAARDELREVPGNEGFLAPPGLADVAAAVETGRAVVYLITSDAGSAGIVASARHGGVKLGVAWIPDFTVNALRGLLFGTDAGGKSDSFLLAQLGRHDRLMALLPGVLVALGKLMTPLARELRAVGARRVALIPFGLLSFLPLHAAAYSSGGRTRAFLDDFEVSYAPSAAVLALADRAAASRTSETCLAGVGGPFPTDQPLRFAAAELEGIAELFPPSAVRALYGARATAKALAAAVPQASHVHLSCHGRYDADEPLESSLALSGGTLSVRELLDGQMFADARLVSASACQTGLADFGRIPDEAFGLPAAFMYAGACGVLASMWPVEDLSTALLMVRCYELMLHSLAQGPSAPAAALGEAQRWLRQLKPPGLMSFLARHPSLQREADAVLRRISGLGADATPFAHPIYWAGFAATGA